LEHVRQKLSAFEVPPLRIVDPYEQQAPIRERGQELGEGALGFAGGPSLAHGAARRDKLERLETAHHREQIHEVGDAGREKRFGLLAWHVFEDVSQIVDDPIDGVELDRFAGMASTAQDDGAALLRRTRETMRVDRMLSAFVCAYVHDGGAAARQTQQGSLEQLVRRRIFERSEGRGASRNATEAAQHLIAVRAHGWIRMKERGDQLVEIGRDATHVLAYASRARVAPLTDQQHLARIVEG
jgi:hypothetical protein